MYSNRYWRGKILKTLREKNNNSDNFSRKHLVASLTKDLDLQEKLQKLIDDLAKEELIWLQENMVGLGDSPVSNRNNN